MPTFQLTPFGLDFLRNGHRLEAAPAEFDISNQKWDNYLSLVWKFRTYTEEDKKPSSQFEQHSFSIYTGGALSERLSYFTEMYLNENTGSTSGSNVAQGDASRKKLAEAYLQYNQPIGAGFLAIRAGEILPEIIHVFGAGARSAEQRALVLNDRANSVNPYKPFTRTMGVDAKLNIGIIEATLGVVNGAANATNAIDTNNHKDWYAAALVAFDQYHSAVGLFHYDGLYSVYTTTTGASTPDDPSQTLSFNDEFTRDGLLFRFIRSSWRVVGAYFIGEDTVNAAGAETDNEGYYALIDFNVTDRLGVFGRYDLLDPNSDTDGNETTQILAGVDGMLHMNERTGTRWNIELSQKKTESTTAAASKTRRALFQLTWSF
jgi:hypothetical protein